MVYAGFFYRINLEDAGNNNVELLRNWAKITLNLSSEAAEEERALIEQKMKLVPTRNMAAYLRKIAIDGYIIQTDHSDIKAMTAEIQKIGVNINQIVKRVNATGNVYQEDIEEIKGGHQVPAATLLDGNTITIGRTRINFYMLNRGRLFMNNSNVAS